jgi:hypothetical protein
MGTYSSRLRSHKDDTVKSHKDDAGFNDSTNATPPETPLGSPRRRISNFYQIKHIEPNEIDEKIRVQNSSKILIIGNNRIKVATACCIRKMIALNDTKVEIMVATRDPDGAKNYPLIRYKYIHMYIYMSIIIIIIITVIIITIITFIMNKGRN